MVKAAGLIHRSLFPLKQGAPVFSGRVPRNTKAPLPAAPHGSPPRVPLQGIPPARETQVVFCSAPLMVRALPGARLTTVLVSHPPAAPFRKPFRPWRLGRL